MDQEILEIIERKDGKVVRINSQVLNKIRSSIESYDREYLINKLDSLTRGIEEPYEIPAKRLFDFIESICSSNDIRIDLGHINLDDFPSLKDLVDEYNEDLDKYKSFRNGDESPSVMFCRSLLADQEKMKTFIDMIYELKQKEDDLFTLRDLSDTKEDMVLNLKYFMSDDLIGDFERKYQEALSKRDTKEMREIFGVVQQQILDHWKEYVTSIDDYKPGDKFKFICHSTYTTEFIGEFYDKYVSASLLSEEQMETYREGFGFILGPNNIVGANSKDMYVHNTADSEEDLLFYSAIKKIDAPERLIEECVKQREENRKNNHDFKVYNEVVLDGFEPLAIFCLTDGSMSLNNNYNNANKLKEQFPDLKIIEIDVTQYKKDEDLFDEKKNLIKNLKERVLREEPCFDKLDIWERQNRLQVSDDMIPRYGLFWKEFINLKKKGTYTEEDIVNIFKHNNELLTIDITEPDIFDKCSDEEMETILKYNYSTGIMGILEGKVELWKLDRTYNTLNKYVDNKKLDDVVPGLTTFLELYKKVPLTEENVDNLSKCSSFKEINQCLLDNINTYQEENNKTIDELKEKIEEYQVEIDSYQKALKEIQSLIDEYSKSQDITSYEFYYKLAKMNIEYEENEKENYKSSEEEYKKKEKESSKKIEVFKEKLSNLSKHPILNARSINKKKEEQMKEEKLLHTIRIKRKEKEESIKKSDQSITDIKKEFKKATVVDFSQYEQALEQAKKNVEETDIIDLEREVTVIQAELANVQAKLDKTKESINTSKKTADVLTPNQVISLMEQGYDVDKKGEKTSKGKTMGYTKSQALGIVLMMIGIIIMVFSVVLLCM